ncbi:MAG TPA: carbon storage regulator [Lacipirellulaceae bacterium]|jgi:carbon storage regulator|nr:carbon storage regulator [Lacipirellulaceae bacterium]
MLVLTRKYQEKIRIGENITITVLRMKGKAVRLGIEAPSTVPVVRGELAFEVELESKDESEAPTVSIEAMDSTASAAGRTLATAAGMTSQWATDSHPDVVSRRVRNAADANVGFSRIPRDKMTEMLPKLVAGTAPLRGMMDRRS